MAVGYEVFTTNQEGIYARIRGKNAAFKAGAAGIERDVKGIGERGSSVSAFLIAYRFGKETEERLGELSERIADIVPAVTYGHRDRNSHVTISDYRLGPQNIDMEGADHIEKEALVRATGRAYRIAQNAGGLSVAGGLTVAYGKDVAVTPTACLYLGQMNQPAYDLRSSILTEARYDGVDLKGGAWGAHTTVARFICDIESVDLADLREAMKTAPDLGVATLTSVDVGALYASDAGFRFEVADSFNLNKTGTIIQVNGLTR